MQLVSTNWAWTKWKLSGWPGLIAGLGLFALSPGLRAQVDYMETNVTVSTIGGGPLTVCGATSGYEDGNTFIESQFDGPVSIALNSQGSLFIADRTNSVIREVTLVGNTASSQTSTILTNAQPLSKSQIVALTVDAGDNLYILLAGSSATNNLLVKYNNSFNQLLAYQLPSPPSALSVSQGANTNIFITFTNGLLLELTQNGVSITGSNTIVAVGAVKWLPAGIAWRNDGVLAVSDLKKNIIYEVPAIANSVPVPYVPTEAATNWVDGNPRFVAFDQPTALAWSADGQLVVTDSGNNALRRIDASGNVSTIYGVNSKLWSKTDCETETYAGWVDGGAGPLGTNATGRTPSSVVIAPNGNIYVSELYYDLLREVQGVGLQPQTATNLVVGTNTNAIVVAPPVFGPAFGYYPECQTITVTSSVPAVFYTEDGTTPTTNSPMVQNMAFDVADDAYIGTFLWCNSQHDLSYLQIISATATQTSLVTTGQTSPVNEIGFPAGALAGVGSTAVIPLVINLQAGQQLQSLQFRVEVNPTSPATPAISSITLLPISTNDFLNLVGPAAGNVPVNYQTFAYTTTTNNGQGLVISAAGDDTGLSVQNFAAALLLEVPIPPTALPGQTYQLNVLYPSGTSDGAEDEITLLPMASETLTVSNVQYMAGDSSPSTGYSAGQFGAGMLDNSDVNNALMASVGIRVPFPFSDAYNAMDVYPETAAGEIGDGFITFLDWQTILFRSLGLVTNNWVRFWTVGGVLSHEEVAWSPGGPPVAVGFPPSPADADNGVSRTGASSLAAGVWFRQASLSAGTVANLLPGSTASIPLYVNVLPGDSLAGFQFRAMLWPAAGTPLAAPLQFNPAAGIPAPAEYSGLSSNEIVCAWSLFDPFTPPLQGSNYLGSITFTVPPAATPGESYTLHFTGVDGAPDLNTQYQLESVPGSAWVASAALAPPQITSDEWRIYYYGSITNPLAADDVVPVVNGVPNWEAYLAGTNPTNAMTQFQFSGAGLVPGAPARINLSWQTAQGKYYVLETSPAIGTTGWTPISTNLGDGNSFQISVTNQLESARFYRIQILQP